MQLLFAVTIFLLLEGLVNAVSTQVRTQTLINDIFHDYDNTQIPICSDGVNTTVILDMALRQIVNMVMMTLHFLNDVAYDAESTQTSKLRHNRFEECSTMGKLINRIPENEKEQSISLNVWLRLKWTDCRLTWKTASYNDTNYISVSYHNIWIPDITLYDSAAEEEMYPIRDQFMGTVYNDGTVKYKYPSFIKSSCVVDVTYFPFDTQKCRLQFGSWSYHGHELDLHYERKQGDFSMIVDNMEWVVVEMIAERNVQIYSCCVEPYPDVTYYIIMKRTPTFYLLTMLFPCMLMSGVAAMSFLLPAESGEKVSLTITVLLSLAVYMLIIAEMLPPASNNFPIIGIYFAVEMGIITVSCVQAVVVLNLFYRGTSGRNVPHWLKTILFGGLGKLFCFQWDKRHQTDEFIDKNIGNNARFNAEKLTIYNPDVSVRNPDKYVVGLGNTCNGVTHRWTPVKQNNKDNSESDQTDATILDRQVKQESIEQYFREKQKEDDINSDWRDVSNLLDRLFMILYVFVTVIVTLVFLLHITGNQEE